VIVIQTSGYKAKSIADTSLSGIVT